MEENIEEVSILAVDASVVLAFLLPDEKTKTIDALFEKYQAGSIRLTSTMLLPFEVTNGLYASVLHKRYTTQEAQMLVSYFIKLRIEMVPIDFEKAFEIAHKEGISVYDASYVVIAIELNIPFMTLDKKLAKIYQKRAQNAD